MKARIFYYSATGNSLMVARDLAAQVGGAQLTAIPVACGEPDFEADRIGIVFPVHLWGMPSSVERFVESMKGRISGKYVFAVATCKSSPRGVLDYLQKKISAIHGTLSAGFIVYMPGNNVIYYNPDPLSDPIRRKWEEESARIARLVALGETCEIGRGSAAERLFFARFAHKALTGTFPKADRRFWVEDRCAGCGGCAQVCPKENIVIVNGKPQWQHRCEQCTACINLCPAGAIQFFKQTQGRDRYKNPLVELRDLKRR